MFVLLVLMLMLMSWVFSFAYASVCAYACAYALVKTSLNMEVETSSICNLEVNKLKPEDIPGEVIQNESQIRKWTVEKLEFWLKCRRLNQQGNKSNFRKVRTRSVTAAG